jgi:hypothetical protein
MINQARVALELAKLKDFQRRTVEHVFQRFYVDQPPANRFLVADEVGLGKTMVARGLITKAIHHLQDTVRVDIVYVCSNAAIANQNLHRLNVLDDENARFATRLTLLPMQIASLKQNRVNFVSFTPGTTFELKQRSGTKEERALLVRMLEGHFDLRSTPLRNLFQAPAGVDGWARTLDACDGATLDEELTENFRSRVASSPVFEQLGQLCARFGRRLERVPEELLEPRATLIGSLRQILASVCVQALEPDLVILDEFQRFKDILHGESEAALLAHQLLNHANVKSLLLSATPYRMLTLSEDSEDDHHHDFLETVRFLTQNESTVSELKDSLGTFRQELFREGADQLDRVAHVRKRIESTLRKVMCRTERTTSTRDRDAMLEEHQRLAPLVPSDIAQAVAVDQLSQLVGAGDAIEYWKSAPYLLSFMDRYELKQNIAKLKPSATDTLGALARNAPFCLSKAQFDAYAQIDPGNARLRALMADTLEAGSAELLWLPPSVPYIAPTGPYARLQDEAATKALVFSSWHVVPKAISVLLSYEAERRMLGANPSAATYEGMRLAHRPLLTFRMEDGKPSGMSALALLYPCATLAAHVDPLATALELGDGRPASLQDCRRYIAERVQKLIDKLVQKHAPAQDGAIDQRWYWAVPALLDAQHHGDVVKWLDDEDAGFRALFSTDEELDEESAHREEGESSSAYDKHVQMLLRVVRGEERLGRVPDDLGHVIADFALASPAVCAARAILRVSRLSAAWDPHVLNAAAQVAKGFRVLFNVPESIVLLRGTDDNRPYWRKVLEYCVDGNLQSVLDEYAHLLVETQGCIGEPGTVIAEEVSAAMLSALSPRTANLSVDEVRVKDGRVVTEPFRVRCRYALRFGEVRDEDGSTVARAETTRDAFNSPFRPFVLASTSVGQEGLDFHAYCHAVYHWNLPSNPVDLEQREGRVHRYKGHAVRRNVGRHYGLAALRTRWNGDGDPWARMFELAAEEKPAGMNELVPYWIFETDGGVSIERRVPLLPMSREVAQLEILKRQLAVYRLAFGQPRQEDLLAYLSGRQLPPGAIEAWRVSLEPG